MKIKDIKIQQYFREVNKPHFEYYMGITGVTVYSFTSNDLILTHKFPQDIEYELFSPGEEEIYELSAKIKTVFVCKEVKVGKLNTGDMFKSPLTNNIYRIITMDNKLQRAYIDFISGDNNKAAYSMAYDTPVELIPNRQVIQKQDDED